MSATPANHAPTAATRMPWFGFALFACALLALAGGFMHRPPLSVAGALLLLLAWLPRVWRRHSAVALCAWLALALLLLVPAVMGHAELALMALPVVFLSAVAWLFARTLKPGAEPLVARFIRLIEGDARLALPGVRGYARGVTVFWACVLAGMACLSLVVALLAWPGGWLVTLGITLPVRVPGSLLVWYPEVGCWLLLLAAFAGEYLFRRCYLRHIPHPSVGRFATQIVRRWPMLVRGGDDRA
ncbi:MAG: xanthomonadin biosynthesis protein [Xanthomonadaceae bacterium]|nr:xanthomonadin biosynthesis protein [Xanthomonadaceae bacterium]